MKSATLPSFWDKYQSLEKQVRQSARKAYQYFKAKLLCLIKSSA